MAIELRVEHDGRRSRSVDTRARPPLELTLINGFELRRAGEPAALPFGAQRLIAFLALREHPVLRSQVAGTLWPEALDGQAGANLRSTLWRIRRSGCSAVEGTGGHIGLAPWVAVDLRETYALAHRVLDPAVQAEVSPSAISRFDRDLLPDWYEDWVQADRERFRQIRLHTLERLAERLAERGLEVRPRGRSTLVSWAAQDADAEVARLAGEGVIVRSIPAVGVVRASVGAWTSEAEIERLVELAAV